MSRIARITLAGSLALLSAAALAHTAPRPDTDLAQAQRLVGQSRRLVGDAHQRSPASYGGHEAKAAALLRLAAIQLNEAHDFKVYGAGKAVRPAAGHPQHKRKLLAKAGRRKVAV